MTYQVAATTVPAPAKVHNGDAFAHTAVEDRPAVVIMVADGIGSYWLASRTACERFLDQLIAAKKRKKWEGRKNQFLLPGPPITDYWPPPDGGRFDF